MTKIRVTKSFGFETGHALYGHDGLCKNIHGHSYKLFVTVIGIPINEANHVKNGIARFHMSTLRVDDQADGVVGFMVHHQKTLCDTLSGLLIDLSIEGDDSLLEQRIGDLTSDRLFGFGILTI